MTSGTTKKGKERKKIFEVIMDEKLANSMKAIIINERTPTNSKYKKFYEKTTTKPLNTMPGQSW